jgi:alkylresorcinol/alkylpyrone synthase
MSTIAAVKGVLPEHRGTQEAITGMFGDVVLGGSPDRRALLERLHAASGVNTRYLALPMDSYRTLRGFGDANDAFIDVGLRLGEEAVRAALDAAGLRPDDVDLVMSVSVTGIAAPSLEARLVDRLGLRHDVKRMPIFGLGCVAGAAGLARLHDYLVGHPDGVAVLLSVELCSLTLQRNDPSSANLVAAGLFGDGAAAVVMVGERRARTMETPGRPAPSVVDTRSRIYPGTERVLGWDVVDGGFRIVLDSTLSDVVERHLGADVEGFLAGHGLVVADIDTWVAHSGGPKVIEAVTKALGLPDQALDVTRRSLAEVGNLSSASVLHVLERTLEDGLPTPGSPGMLIAMGPGFSAELVLLRW